MHKQILWILTGGSFLFGLIGNYLFNDNGIGISYGIFTILFYVLFFAVHKDIINKKDWFGWFLCIPVILLSFSFSLFNNPVLFGINIVLIPLLLFIQTIVFTQANQYDWFRGMFIFDVLDKVIRSIGNILTPFKELGRQRENGVSGFFGKFKFNNARILKGLLISLPILIVVIALLISADDAFAEILNEIARWLGFLEWWKFVDDIVLTLALTVATAGYLWTLYVSHQSVKKDEYSGSKKDYDSVTFTVLLGGLNLVYLLFVFVQFVYLFGGEQNIIDRGLTYSEYAVKGFWELMMVSILNISILALASEKTKFASKKAQMVVKVLSSGVGILSFVLAYSAHARLSLYQDTFGFTYQRIFAHTIIFLLVILILLALVKTWKKSFSFIQGLAVSCLSVYVVLNLVNVDMLIAKKNIARFEANGDLDIEYLTGLSVDTYPLLFEISQNEDIKKKYGQFRFIDAIRVGIEEEQLEGLRWVEYNKGKVRAYDVFEKNIKDEIIRYDDEFNTWFKANYTRLYTERYPDGNEVYTDYGYTSPYPDDSDQVEIIYADYKYGIDVTYNSLFNNIDPENDYVEVTDWGYGPFSSRYVYRKVPLSEVEKAIATIKDVRRSLIEEIKNGCIIHGEDLKREITFIMRDINRYSNGENKLGHLYGSFDDVLAQSSASILTNEQYQNIKDSLQESGTYRNSTEFEGIYNEFLYIKATSLDDFEKVIKENHEMLAQVHTYGAACNAEGFWVLDIGDKTIPTAY